MKQRIISAIIALIILIPIIIMGGNVFNIRAARACTVQKKQHGIGFSLSIAVGIADGVLHIFKNGCFYSCHGVPLYSPIVTKPHTTKWSEM